MRNTMRQQTLPRPHRSELFVSSQWN